MVRMRRFNYELACVYICIACLWIGVYIVLFTTPSPNTVHETIKVTIPPTICFDSVDDVAAFYGISTKDAAKVEIPKECKE